MQLRERQPLAPARCPLSSAWVSCPVLVPGRCGQRRRHTSSPWSGDRCSGRLASVPAAHEFPQMGFPRSSRRAGARKRGTAAGRGQPRFGPRPGDARSDATGTAPRPPAAPASPRADVTRTRPRDGRSPGLRGVPGGLAPLRAAPGARRAAAPPHPRAPRPRPPRPPHHLPRWSRSPGRPWSAAGRTARAEAKAKEEEARGRGGGRARPRGRPSEGRGPLPGRGRQRGAASAGCTGRGAHAPAWSRLALPGCRRPAGV